MTFSDQLTLRSVYIFYYTTVVKMYRLKLAVLTMNKLATKNKKGLLFLSRQLEAMIFVLCVCVCVFLIRKKVTKKKNIPSCIYLCDFEKRERKLLWMIIALDKVF